MDGFRYTAVSMVWTAIPAIQTFRAWPDRPRLTPRFDMHRQAVNPLPSSSARSTTRRKLRQTHLPHLPAVHGPWRHQERGFSAVSQKCSATLRIAFCFIDLICAGRCDSLQWPPAPPPAMFIRVKHNGSHDCLRVVHSQRVGDRPVCSEVWPGNTTDVKTLLPLVRRLLERFGIEQVCIVSDRGMISDGTVAVLEDRFPGLKYFLWARLRSDHEGRDTVLSWGGAYHEVHGPGKQARAHSPLKVEEVRFTAADGGDRRLVACHNVEQS